MSSIIRDPSLPSHRWDRYQRDISNYLSISLGEAQMKSYLKPEGVTFWNDVIPSLQQRLFDDKEAKIQYPEHTLITWILCSLCIIMAVLILVLSCVLYRMRKIHLLSNGPVSVWDCYQCFVGQKTSNWNRTVYAHVSNSTKGEPNGRAHDRVSYIRTWNTCLFSLKITAHIFYTVYWLLSADCSN